jgi:hypothetical protein
MPQIFPKSANAWSKASIFMVLGLVLTLGWTIMVLQRSDFVTAAGTYVDQPVQFSHQHHVGGIGIDCRYCHNSVEVAATASIPPTKTCINCHSQIWSTSPYLEPVRASFREDKPLQWIRVHDLPDFVYFNHSIHVKKGVGCETCHGRVDKMPLMRQQSSLQMEWCLDCHRRPEAFVRPRSDVFNVNYARPPNQLELGRRLVEEYQIQKLTSCSTCHQ